MKVKWIHLLVFALVLAACGGDETTDDTSDGGTGDGANGSVSLPGEPVCIGEGDDAPDFVGLTEQEAVELADERNLRVREVGRDGECFPVTMDLRSDRVNLEFIGDVVVGAAIY